MIAHVCCSTGWTWDYVAENIDLPRLATLNEYWRGHPPTHVMVAAYFGIKPEGSKTADAAPVEQDFGDLFAIGTFKEGPLI